MPRIEPVQLLNCLRVLLDENGGILSTNEVKRLEGLMTKYSKKLVSKCIYVLILKSTKTELLDEFMAAGGWSLVYTWLNDAVRGMNWPLVQEVVELLLLSPVQVERMKINSAPRLVKSLSKEGGTESVRILAQRLVDQWLSIVSVNTNIQKQQQTAHTQKEIEMVPNTSDGLVEMSVDVTAERDPLDGVGENVDATYALTPAQKKANESGLVYKIILKNGQQVLAKVTPTKSNVELNNSEGINNTNELRIDSRSEEYIIQEEDEENSALDLIEEDMDYEEQQQQMAEKKDTSAKQDNVVLKVNSSSKGNKESDIKRKSSDGAKSSSAESKDKKDKDKSRDKSKSSHRSSSSSSSNHKSTSEKKSSTSSSSNKSKSSSSHRSSSSSDKHRSSSSSSSKKDDKHRSSTGSSKSSSSSSNSKSKSNSSSSSSVKKLEKSESVESALAPLNKERDATKQALEKLGRIPKKVKTGADADAPTSIVIPSKKASISIEIRRDNEKASTVKTYKSQFRSHGLNEAAPPPPSRKGLKKPPAPTNTNIIPMVIPSLKRASPPLVRETQESKKPKIDINNVTVPNAKPGAIKLIPPKKNKALLLNNHMCFCCVKGKNVDNNLIEVKVMFVF